jgi:hypothetical protein
MQTFLTTATCITDYVSWAAIDFDAKVQLSTLYGPYLAVGMFAQLISSLSELMACSITLRPASPAIQNVSLIPHNSSLHGR